MTKNPSALRTSGVIGCAAAALALRAYMLFTAAGTAAEAALYALIGAAVLLQLWDSLRTPYQTAAFSPDNRWRLHWFAYTAAVGFFADFVLHCHLIYQSVASGAYHIFAGFAPLCITAAGALLSSFYYCLVGLSYASQRYDFRTVRWMHLVPVLWAIGRMLALISATDAVRRTPHTVLQYALTAAALLWSFFLLLELARGGSVMRMTVFFNRLLVLLAELFFFDTLMLLLDGALQLGEPDTVTAAAVLLIGSFAFALEKNIMLNASMENN